MYKSIRGNFVDMFNADRFNPDSPSSDWFSIIYSIKCMGHVRVNGRNALVNLIAVPHPYVIVGINGQGRIVKGSVSRITEHVIVAHVVHLGEHLQRLVIIAAGAAGYQHRQNDACENSYV